MPWWVLLSEMVPGYYPRTILVNLPVSEMLLGSLRAPKTAKNSMKTDQKCKTEQKPKFVRLLLVH